MSRFRRARSTALTLARVLVVLVALLLILIGIGLTALETGWAKNQIRALIVRQANQYLTATLDIGRLEGSLLRGLQLGDITLSRNGQPLIAIDEVALSYSIRELYQNGTVIRSIRLTRPRIVAAKQADGRWDLGALIKRDSQDQGRTGPQRPIEIQAIEIQDGRVLLRDPLDFGAAHVPTSFTSLDAKMAFVYRPVKWTLTFQRVSWIGREPTLDMNRLSGAFGRSPDGWFFDHLSVRTPRSAFTLDGRVNQGPGETTLDLQVGAGKFAFQEWSGVLPGLSKIAVDASFDTTLKGPLSALGTDLRLSGTGGDVSGQLTLNTRVPGWHGAGAVDVARLNLARWLSLPDRRSDITGHVTFDLDLDLGRHFPRGTYTFKGPHTAFMEYAADQVDAAGHITARNVIVERATAVAYGANVTLGSGSVGLDAPFPYRFQGTMAALDLRRVPATVPVPRVESVLAFTYDVNGRFVRPYIAGRAEFAPSVFLGAGIGAGTIGTVDTSAQPIRYGGSGTIDNVDLNRFGRDLDIAWMRDPRYAGTVSGRFDVDGAGADRASLMLAAGGRISRAHLFRGAVADADVTLHIERGTLATTFRGGFSAIDPAVAFGDPRFMASLTGSATVDTTVRDLLTRTTVLSDYVVSGSLTLGSSTVGRVAIDTAAFEGTLRDELLTLTRADVTGEAIQGTGSGTLAFTSVGSTDFQYDIARADLARLRPAYPDAPMTKPGATGVVTTKGRVTGPRTALHAVGDATVTKLEASSVSALTMTGQYDATVPEDAGRAHARVTARGSFLKVLGQEVDQSSGTVTYDAGRLGFNLELVQAQHRNGAIAGSAQLHADRRTADLLDLTVTLGRSPWRLLPATPPPAVSWNDEQIAITAATFTGGAGGDERIGVSGTWRDDGKGALRVTASHVFLETLQGILDRPARLGGVIDADAVIRGTRDSPLMTGTFTIADGRVERISYEKLTARVDYAGDVFDVDVRLDQKPGVSLTAVGKVPLALFDRGLPERPIDVAITSTPIDLGLIQGVTSAVSSVTGFAQINVKAVGTSRDPHFEGAVDISQAGFLVEATGVRYRNVAAGFRLSTDRVTVESLHMEDPNGRPLDMRGSLATHEMRIGDLAMEITADRFEVIRNAFGRVAVNATVRIGGQFESPRATGDITLNNGELKVDAILDRTVYQPYSTEPAATPSSDAVVAALSLWNRLALDLTLHIPATLRLTGQNVQVSPGTPVGLGDINLRGGGDLYLYKDSISPLSITGSIYSMSGTYRFQGRRFDIDEANSSINFHGDLNPQLYVTVTRPISGVETRVTLTGSLSQPELRLSSIPPLDASDILSLIVFNATPSELTTAQQQELAARAGALAAGFLAQPLMAAIEREIGLDILELEPSSRFSTGPKITLGDEIAPGLIARFSRQFGSEPYDEATVEYYLSRILRLRATFSDAQSLATRSPFRRVERAGIDLLVFFSF